MTAPILVNMSNVFEVDPDSASASPVYLAGPADRQPRYDGARLVLYNFNPALAPITESALNAATAPLRELLREALESGYSKENVRRELAQGLVREVGMAFPAIDELEEEGLRVPPEADGCAFGSGTLDCP